MELSEEMQEALRILREDGQIKAYREMTESHKAMVQRMDEMETKNSERDARWEERMTPGAGKGEEGKEAGGGDGGNSGGGEPGSGVDTGKGVGNVPEPPPLKKEEEPPAYEKPRRKKWHETDVYVRGE